MFHFLQLVLYSCFSFYLHASIIIQGILNFLYSFHIPSKMPLIAYTAHMQYIFVWTLRIFLWEETCKVLYFFCLKEKVTSYLSTLNYKQEKMFDGELFLYLVLESLMTMKIWALYSVGRLIPQNGRKVEREMLSDNLGSKNLQENRIGEPGSSSRTESFKLVLWWPWRSL